MVAPVSESPAGALRAAPAADETRRRAPEVGGVGGDDALEAEPAPSTVQDLGALRRRLDDLAAQHRKTHATTHQLAESIAALVAGQRQRLRWLNLNSFVAYVIFTLLLGAAFYTLYARRADALVGEQRALAAARDAAEKKAASASAELAARTSTSQRALAAYELYRAGKAQAAHVEHQALGASLSPLEQAALTEAHERATKGAFEVAFEKGLAAFRAGTFAAAVEPFGQAIDVGTAAAGLVPTAQVAQARYYLGLCQARAGQLGAAKEALGTALAEGVELADARYQLAMVLDRAGELGRARTEYEKFASAHPKLPLAVVALRRAAVLARWGRAAPPLPPLAAPAPAPAPWGQRWGAPRPAMPGVAPRPAPSGTPPAAGTPPAQATPATPPATPATPAAEPAPAP